MNGLNYTSISFIEMNVVVSTSVVRQFVDGFLPWVHCYFVVVQYCEDSYLRDPLFRIGSVLRGF